MTPEANSNKRARGKKAEEILLEASGYPLSSVAFSSWPGSFRTCSAAPWLPPRRPPAREEPFVMPR